MKIADQNRSFGLLLGICCAIAAIFAYRAGRSSDIVWAVLAFAFVLAALVVPRVLAPARRGWLKIGHWLSFVINPIVLGAVYCVVFIPFGFAMRLFGRDPMARRFDPAAKTYWVEGRPADDVAARLKEQF
jgi:Saxitoxin biosynthesis operon protein SxtJ